MDKGGEMAQQEKEMTKSEELYPTGYLLSRYTLVVRLSKLFKATIFELYGVPIQSFGQEADVGAWGQLHQSRRVLSG